jgi:hypothetical protein
MRYKAVFIVGFAAGFVAGARAGRGAYDQIVRYSQKIAGHPKVQQATSTVQAKATDLGKQAAAKAPDYAKSAAASATSAAKSASTQVPKIVSNAKQAATDKIPARFGRSGAGAGADDVAADGTLVYPADGGAPLPNGAHYTPDTP